MRNFIAPLLLLVFAVWTVSGYGAKISWIPESVRTAGAVLMIVAACYYLIKYWRQYYQDHHPTRL